MDDNFPEDRLIIVLFHELGHAKYLNDVPLEQQKLVDSEYRAFENSIDEAIRIAESGDHGPLKVALHYIQNRRNSAQEPSHYQDALDRITASELWNRAEKLAGRR